MELSGVTTAMAKTFLGFLKTEIPALSTFEDFPNPSQKLSYPTASLKFKSSEYEPRNPYVIYKGSKILTGPNAGKFPVRRVMGQWEIQYQLDLWTDSKPSRHAFFNKIMSALSKDSSVNGLSIQLPDWFNEWARFDLKSAMLETSESESQTAEWRSTMSLIGTVRHVVDGVDNLMEQIENKLEFPQQIDPAATPSSDPII